ncbi:XRE family transcriptional regulator (plasmid) [Chryseobacterium joostei]|uniref:Helix-turn-helix domain-containing protein n=1 Tax=Chryseobacterium joostei TaxID=112234 RepID=A0A1N7KFQ4_9FLAO|nr:helix-turn-helix transcriptional regulator [Chryseobacterium joostei]AZB02425.1 XRE family transcriptional regulator [Chryseobacterium joostei]SIS60413.1 Helix-turn-helix domain-containing protein [Chryseobacterium joostei]
MKKEKLRYIRKLKGYSQRELAEIIFTEVSNYSRKETGTVKISRSEWIKLAQFLEVPLEEIYQSDSLGKKPIDAYTANLEHEIIILESELLNLYFYEKANSILKEENIYLKRENERLKLELDYFKRK